MNCNVDGMTESADQDFSPFAAFDVFAGTTRDPFPDFADYRANRPVWPGSLADLSNLPVDFLPKEQWSVYRYEDVSRVFRETKTFDSRGYNDSMGLLFGPTILGMDGAEHRAHRNLVAHAFKERSLQRWEPEFIAPVCNELIDAVIEEGRADLVQALTFEFPSTCHCPDPRPAPRGSRDVPPPFHSAHRYWQRHGEGL